MPRDGVTWSTVPAPRGQLYEGPTWVEGAGVFQWVDILAASVHRWDPRSDAPAESRSLDLEFTTVALPLDGDRSLVASRSSLHEYSWRSGQLTTVGEWPFSPDIRFNDGAIAPNGDVYIGTMSMDRRPDAAALYRLNPTSGELAVVLDGIGISNGLAWQSQTRALYIDSLVPQVDLLTFGNGPVRREAWIKLGAELEPDGMALRPDGSVLVALWGSGKAAWASTNERRAELIDVPPLYPTSAAFGGRDGELILLTSASCELDATDADGFVYCAMAEE